MKKLLLIMTAALLLCGCGSGTPGDSQSAAQSEQTSGSLFGVVDWKALGDSYSREAVLKQNLTCELGMEEEWARMYVAQKFQAFSLSSIIAAPKEGSAIAAGFLTDKDIKLQTYQVRFLAGKDIEGLSQEGDGFYDIWVQVITIQNGLGTSTLSGILDGDQIITRPEQLVDYLNPDSRCIVKGIPVPTVSEGTTLYNLTEQLLGCYGQPVAAEKGFVAYIKRESSEESPTYSLMLHNLVTGKSILVKAYGKLNTCSLSLDKKPLEVKYRYDKDEMENANYFALDGTPATKTMEQFPLPGSKTTILNENGNVYSLDKSGQKTLLLEANKSDDEKTMFSYSCIVAIDDHRFAFIKSGWETVLYSGVFNVTSRSETKISSDIVLTPKAVGNGKLYLETDVYSSGGEIKAYVWTLDLNKTGSVPVPMEDFREILAFSPDMRYALCSKVADDSRKLLVWDLLTNEQKAEFKTDYLSGWDRFQFWDNNTLIAFSRDYPIFDRYLIAFEIQ